MEEHVTKIDSLSELEKVEGGEYSRWQSEIAASERELDKWRRKARKIVKEFRAERVEVSGVDPSMERRFNLFAANVQILTTSLINQTPDPSVNREFKDPQDDVGRVACEIMERALSSHNRRNFKVPAILRQVVQDMLVPGGGLSWHTYRAETETRVEEDSGVEYDEIVLEELKDEYIYWEDILWSPCRTYDEMRWIGRKVYMTRDQGVKRFGPKFKKVPLDYTPKKTENSVESREQVFQQAVIYEIWDRQSKLVIWFSKGHEELLDKKKDFLGLEGFWPCPCLLMSSVSNGKYIPIPDYHYASDQYKELNEVNTRVSLLVRACRVAGAYDKASPQIKDLLNNAAENTLVPVDQWAAFAEKGGVKGVIDWIPLEQIVKVLEQLLKNREDIKNQIYELTGMSDIIRGTSKATETLGAQKIKAQYASMRIQERQKAVVVYCSTVFDIQCQLMRKHMGEQEIAKLAQIQFMNEDPQLIEQAMQLIKNPEFELRAQVESDSLSDIDFQAEKQDRMEYMTTVTNYLKETMPMIQQDPLMGPFLMQLLQFSLAGFKIGKKFEGELDKTFAEIQQKLQNPEPPKPSPEEQKAQAEIKLKEQEGQLNAQEGQQKLALKQQEGQQKMTFKQQDHAMKMGQLQQKSQVEGQVNAQKLQQSQAQFWQKIREQQIAHAQKAFAQGVPPGTVQ
jgi:hypothetical protein